MGFSEDVSSEIRNFILIISLFELVVSDGGKKKALDCAICRMKRIYLPVYFGEIDFINDINCFCVYTKPFLTPGNASPLIVRTSTVIKGFHFSIQLLKMVKT